MPVGPISIEGAWKVRQPSSAPGPPPPPAGRKLCVLAAKFRKSLGGMAEGVCSRREARYIHLALSAVSVEGSAAVVGAQGTVWV